MTRRHRKPLVFVGLAVMLFGLVFGGVGLALLLSAPDTDSTAEGTLVRINPDGDTCSGSATFEVDGKPYTATSKVSSDSMCDEVVGTTVQVRYSSADPTVNEFGMRQSTFSWIFVGIGSPIVLVGLGLQLWGLLSRAPAPAGVPGVSVAAPPAPPAPPSDALPPPPADADGSVRPGWYPTEDGLHERWHNGMGWSDTVRPRQR